MLAIDAVLQDTAEQRAEAQKLPGRDEFILTPLWTETREDREKRIRNLLDSALGIVTDVPIVDMQKKVEGLRRNIRDIEAEIAALKEKQITAPKDGMLPGVLTDTVDSLNGNIADAEKRIDEEPGRDRQDQDRDRRRAGEVRRRDWRPSRSTCCSTACCRATSCASSPCSTRPRSSTPSSASC